MEESNVVKKDNKKIITIIIAIIVVIAIGVAGYFILSKDKKVSEEEILTKIELNEISLKGDMFESFMIENSLEENEDETIEHFYTLSNNEVSIKVVYHLDTKLYNETKDRESSITETIYFNDNLVEGISNIDVMAKLDETHLIGYYNNNESYTYFIINSNGKVEKTFISSASYEDATNNVDTRGYVMYDQNDNAKEIVYYAESCELEDLAELKGYEYHLENKNGTYTETSKNKVDNIRLQGMSTCN